MSVQVAPWVDSQRSCTSSPCLRVYPALGRSHEWTDPCASPYAPLSIWQSVVAWASCFSELQLCGLFRHRCGRRCRGRPRLPESPVWPPIFYQVRSWEDEVLAYVRFCQRSPEGRSGVVAPPERGRCVLRAALPAVRPVPQVHSPLLRRSLAGPCLAAVAGCASGI